MSKSKSELKVSYHGMLENSEMRLHFYWEPKLSDELPVLGHDLLFGQAVSFVIPLCMHAKFTGNILFFMSC